MATFHTPMVTLNDGNLIPQIGLGVLRIDDEGVTSVVESALEAGYRHIDGAAGYNNEAGVGRALNNAGFTEGEQRKNLWVTTKLRDSEQGYDSARKAFDRQLGLLQLDYVDMYMLHWPTPFDWRSSETWKAFQEFRGQHLHGPSRFLFHLLFCLPVICCAARRRALLIPPSGWAGSWGCAWCAGKYSCSAPPARGS